MEKNKNTQEDNFSLIEKDYLENILSLELDKLEIHLVYIEIKLLKSIGARIEATIFRDSGISHDDCSLTTKMIKSVIDEKYNNADEYTITVSSPGFKWLFRGQKEFEIFQNAPIKVVYTKAASEIIKAKTMTGILLSSDDESIEIENEKNNMTISKSAISKIYLNY